MSAQTQESRFILGGRIDVTDHQRSEDWIFAWAAAGESRFVTFSTVHMIMEAYDSPAFQSVLNASDLNHPDGMPLRWVQKLTGASDAGRVTGTDQTLRVCARAARDGVPVGFYGASPETLERLVSNLQTRFPGLQVVYSLSPPFRGLTPAEDEQITADIAASGARLVFVGIGCPKQERWSFEHRGRFPGVILAVGAAFDWIAGDRQRAPKWIQTLGLEWLHRVVKEPRRLWKRYLTTNPRFLLLIALQLLGLRRIKPAPPATRP